MYNYRHRINLKVPPVIEPITLEEAKDYLGITGTQDDDVITDWIVAVRQNVELYTGLSMMTQTWQLFLDWFPAVPKTFIYYYYYRPPILEIPKAPLDSITHIKYYDKDDNETTVSNTMYQVVKYSAINPWQGRISFKDDFSPPYEGDLRRMDNVEIEFIAGYATPEEVPQSLKMAMLQEIAFRNKNKLSGDIESEAVPNVYSVKYGTNNASDSSGLSASTKNLLMPFKKIRI